MGNVEDSIIETANGLYSVGLINQSDMREFEKSCLTISRQRAIEELQNIITTLSDNELSRLLDICNNYNYIVKDFSKE